MRSKGRFEKTAVWGARSSVLLTKYHQGYHIKIIRWARKVARMGEIRHAYSFDTWRKDYLDDLGIEGGMMLELGGSEYDNTGFCFCKTRWIQWLAEELLAPQRGLYSLELATCTSYVHKLPLCQSVSNASVSHSSHPPPPQSNDFGDPFRSVHKNDKLA